MATKRLLVYGGKGALGATIVKYFKSLNWWVGSIDLIANDDAHANIVIHPAESWVDQNTYVLAKVREALGDEKIDALCCVAGGWAGGNAASPDLVQQADLMWKQSVWTSVIAASIGTKYLKSDGVFMLTGAQAALGSTPGMIGYGLSKAAVHQLVRSLSDAKSGLPENTFVAAILPVTLDTPMNRKFMPKADFGSWTPLDTIAELLFKWYEGEGRPAQGSLVQLITKAGKTECIPASL